MFHSSIDFGLDESLFELLWLDDESAEVPCAFVVVRCLALYFTNLLFDRFQSLLKVLIPADSLTYEAFQLRNRRFILVYGSETPSVNGVNNS